MNDLNKNITFILYFYSNFKKYFKVYKKLEKKNLFFNITRRLLHQLNKSIISIIHSNFKIPGNNSKFMNEKKSFLSVKF